MLDSASAGGFDDWRGVDGPNQPVIYTDFYVYNLTNAWAFAHGAKPVVQQVGPLHYYYKQQKLNISWDPDLDGDVVEYNQWQCVSRGCLQLCTVKMNGERRQRNRLPHRMIP